MDASGNVYYHTWNIKNPKANIILVHGLGEHIQRYEEWARYLNNLGYSIYGFDQLGHGKSGGKRGHIAEYEHTYSIIDGLFKQLDGDVPIFLYGHSFGGNMILNYAIDRRPRVSGYIASGPFIKAGTPISPFLLFIGRIMSVIYPSLQLDNGLDLNNLSTDPAIIEAYKNDPLVHSKVSARLAARMIDKAAYLTAFKDSLNAPLLLMHGEKDIITGPHGSRIFAEQIQSKVDLKIWPNDFHEIHNGMYKKAVWEKTVDWLKTLV